MKKLAFLISTLFLSAPALSEDVSRDFNILFEVPYSCEIEIAANNEIEDGSLVLDEVASSDVTFGCTDLNGVQVIMASLNGGMMKGEDATKLIHYTATVTAENLTPNPVSLDTEITGTAEVAGEFISATPIPTVVGQLQVRPRTPTGWVPAPGRYEDTLRLTLRSPIARAA